MTALMDSGATVWTEICAVSRIPVAYGVGALLGNGEQIALFRTEAGQVLAIGNIDPISGAAVLSRGIVGDVGGVPCVASPIYKERFDLRTGVCLDDTDASVPTYPVRVEGDVVYVGSA